MVLIKRSLILVSIILIIFIFYLSSYSEVNMVNNQVLAELMETAKVENWKMASLQELDSKNLGIKVFSFNDAKTLIVYKDKVSSLDDPMVILSNDSQKIAFWISKDNGLKSLFIIDSNGLNLNKVIDIYGGHNICWSWDSKNIAFVGMLNEKNNTSSLYIVDINTKKTDVLIDNVDYITSQSWSPDNSEFLYVKNGIILSYCFSSKLSRKIVAGNWPVWSPRGDWIAYLGKGKISIINPITYEQNTLIENKDISTPIYWLPNCQFITFGKCLSEHCGVGVPFVIDVVSKQIGKIREDNWILSSWSK